MLRRVGEDFEIVSNGVFLMDTRDGRSERLLATAALAAHAAPSHVLIGGLGVGFTLATALADARVSSVAVVEVEPTIVGWNVRCWPDSPRGPLMTRESAVLVTDLVHHLASTGAAYDVICVDIDNGPDWMVFDGNGQLYNAAGTSLLRARLGPGGVLAVWSSRAVPKYEDRLRSQFGELVVYEVPTERGQPDVVYVAVC